MSTRMCIEFGEDQSAALDRLAGTLDVTKASILRFGLTLLAIAVREAQQGRSIGVVQGDHVVKEIAGAWSDLTPAA